MDPRVPPGEAMRIYANLIELRYLKTTSCRFSGKNPKTARILQILHTQSLALEPGDES